MAGNYPDVPSWRMAFDRDGTQVYGVDNGPAVQISSEKLKDWNSEDIARPVGGIGNTNFAFIFPELRDLDAAYCFQTWNGNGIAIQVSADTTNGVDGTWTAAGTVVNGNQVGGGGTGYRTHITSFTALGIKAVKFMAIGLNGFIETIHLYGEPVPAASPDRLDIWHPALDQRVDPSYFDWGNVPRDSVATKQFRVKNRSATLTAQTPRVAMESLFDTTPSVPGWHQLSLDGASWLAQVNIGDLAPGAISAPITIRRQPPVTATLGLWAFRVFSEASAWV